MLRSVLLVVLLGVLVSSLAFKRPRKHNLRVVRRLPKASNHYHHDPADVDMMGFLVYLGTTANWTQVMNPEMEIDTTIADTTIWVCTDVSPGPPDYGNYCFNPHYSSTFVNISANLASDTFSSPDGTDPWTIPNVTFATHYTSNGYDAMAGGASGTIGFAWPSLQTTSATYLPFKLFDHYGVNMFSMGLGLTGCSGITEMGTDCEFTMSGNIPFYVPVTSQTLWQFAVMGFRFGTVRAMLLAQGVIVSKKGYIGMPNKYLTHMMSTYGIQWDGLYGAYTVDCTQANLPDFDILFDGGSVVIKAAQYVYTREPLENGRCVVSFEDSKAYGFGPEWYFGVPLLQSQCVTFDFDNKRIGFTTNIDTADEDC